MKRNLLKKFKGDKDVEAMYKQAVESLTEFWDRCNELESELGVELAETDFGIADVDYEAFLESVQTNKSYS